MQMSRRQFLGASAVVGGGLALTGSTVLKGLGLGTADAATPEPEEKLVRTTCNPECNHCGFFVHVRNGRAVRITPDPNYYQRPCLRGYSRLQWTYHPDRIKYPFKRVGERGEGKWERISWDEALDLVASKLGEVRDKYGPQSTLFLGGAVMSSLRLFAISRFANGYGKGVTTDVISQLCCAAQDEAESATIGYRFGSWETVAASKLIVNWGHNPAVTYQAHWQFVADARNAGARMITIDPRYSDSAALSDKWLAPRPGTDAALALSMIHVILTEGRYDKDFVMQKTNLPFLVNEATGKLLRTPDKGFLVWDQAAQGPVAPEKATAPVLDGQFEVEGAKVRTVFTRLKERAARYEAQKASEITGVPADQIVSFAREYAGTKPAMINSVMAGAQRTSFGEYFTASLVYLAALTGNLGIAGGGVNDTGGPLMCGNLNIGEFVAPHPPASKGQIPVTKLGEWMLANKPYPIKAVLWQGKGLGQQPNSRKLREALLKTDFMVVQEHFMTDAAQIADVILPAATLFEYTDLEASHINHYYQLIDKVVDPLWEARPDTWIYSQLAKRLGFGDDWTKTDEEWVDLLLKNTDLSAAKLRKDGPAWEWGDASRNRFGVKWEKKPFWYFKDTPFLTPSKRVEFHATRWEDKGVEPMVDYFPPLESPEKSADRMKQYPLNLVAAKIRTKVHSTFALMPWLSEIYPQGWVDINTEDAKARGISEGDTVEVFNDRGSAQVAARVHAGIRRGVVSLQNGWWMQQGSNGSQMTTDAPSAIAMGHTLNSTLVEVRRA